MQAESYPQIDHANIHSTPTADFLAGGGEMGERIRSFDWSATPLGPVEQWPQSLKTITRIMLTSRQPIWIGWGPELTKLYNDPYKAIVGGKHPEALGQAAAVVWREIWDVLGPRLQVAVEQNEGTYDEALLLIMERYGYPEETYYTFSYSPVPGDLGGVGGIICANTDDTARIIGERQVKLLRTLAAQTADAHTVEDACHLSASSLAQNPQDIPFAMIYLLDQATQTVALAGTAGIAPDHPFVPQTADLDSATPWPFASVLRDQKVCLMDELEGIGDNFPTGAWQRPPHQVVAVPIAPSGHSGKAGVLILGLNPFRRFDESYQGFANLMSSQIAASLANAQAYEEERKRAESLAELDRAKTLFFSNISHEFRTPLTLMLGPIEDTLADTQALTPELRERIELLHRNALRLSKLVNILLDFSRLEAGRVKAVFEPTDLATLTNDLASSFRSVMEKAGLIFIVDCPLLDEPVYVDHEMWEKIVLNLLSNALKYTLEGEVIVTLVPRDTVVELSVTDTGVGIPAEELPYMFERFHRVSGTAGRTIEGTGIGLSLVYELAKLHGGTISVTSEPGEGSTFSVTLPRGSAHLPQDQIAVQQTVTATTASTQFYVDEAIRLLASPEAEAAILPDALVLSDGNYANSKGPLPARILFVDDNADMRDYVSRLLQPLYTVQVIADGQAALNSVKESPPDLVLTDVMMPRMDGFELLHALRADPQTRTIPVILLSARAGEEAISEGMEAGADDYLIKPFSGRELLARVGAHLEIARLHAATDQQVRAERERLYRLFQQAPAAIAVLEGATLRYELANPLYQQVFHRTEKQLIGKTMHEVFSEVEGQSISALLKTVFTSGEAYIGNEFPSTFDRSRTGNLETGYFNFVAQPLASPTGIVERIMLHAVEITEQIVARKRIEELLRQKDDFIGIASHELKTPLTSLKAYAQLLERRFRQSGDARSADLLVKMIAQANKLTNCSRRPS